MYIFCNENAATTRIWSSITFLIEDQNIIPTNNIHKMHLFCNIIMSFQSGG